jgi:hypothetical protein
MLGTSKSTQGLVSSYDPSGTGPGFSLQYSDEQSSVRMLLTPDGSGTCMIDGTTDIEDGLWHHVAAVVRRRDSCTTDDILLFIDGVQETTSVASSSADTASAQDMANPLEMGSLGLGNSGFLYGSLDNVMIWNRSFSSYQVGEIYDSFFLPEDDNPRDGCIQKEELLAAINDWKRDSTTYPMYWIMGLVTMWTRGFGCVS